MIRTITAEECDVCGGLGDDHDLSVPHDDQTLHSPTKVPNAKDVKLNVKFYDTSVNEKGVRLFGYLVTEIKWVNLLFLVVLHVMAVYGLVHAMLIDVKFFTAIFVSLLSIFSGLGMSVGM